MVYATKYFISLLLFSGLVVVAYTNEAGIFGGQEVVRGGDGKI